MKVVAWVKEVLGFDHEPTGYWYVYRIKDPRIIPPRVRYVGKGTGNRMYQHAKDAKILLKRGTPKAMMSLSCLHKWFIELWDEDLEPAYEIIYRTDDEDKAYAVEAEQIRRIGLERLLNETYGHKNNGRTK